MILCFYRGVTFRTHRPKPRYAMHIVIDARRIRSQATGIGAYTYHLLKYLPEIAPGDHFTAIVNQETFPAVKHLPDLSFYHTYFSLEDHFLGDLWRQAALPLLLWYIGADVFHDPGMLLPWGSLGVPKVVTLHDLAHYRHPETNSAKYGFYMRFMTHLAVWVADRIITDSQAVAQEIQVQFNLPLEKVVPVPLAVNGTFHPALDEGEYGPILSKFSVKPGYFLAVSTLEPRKNFLFLLDVYEHFRKQSSIAVPLVVAGPEGWKNEKFHRRLASHPFREDIRLTGYVCPEELVALYQGAGVFLMPSMYEGFGLPVLEAMACGVPVISSDASSLPEVAGDAGILCSPTDQAPWVEAINQVLGDEAVASKMRRDGLDQAARFTWERCARATYEVYQTTVARG